MPERREASRYPLQKDCVLDIEGRQVNARVENLSRKGCLLRITEAGNTPVTNEDLGRKARFVLSSATGSLDYDGEIIRMYFADGAYHVAVRFWKDSGQKPD